MKRTEVYDYYSALDATSRLIDIDCSDSLATIEQKLLKVSKNTLGTFHIEIFKNDENIQSYSLSEIYQEDKNIEPVYSLWEQKTSKVNNTTINDLAKYIFNNMPRDTIVPFTHCIVSVNKENGTCRITSFPDMSDVTVIDLPTKASEAKKILGCFILDDGTILAKPVNHADLTGFMAITENIESQKIRTFAQTFIRIIPDYTFKVAMDGANSNANASDASLGGIARHCINMARIVIALTKLDFYKIKFSRAEIDKMIVACLFSSFLRSGWQDEYEINSTTRVDYPKDEARIIRAMTGILEKNDLKFIANLVESHLGQTTEESTSTIDTECKFLVYMAHFLAGNSSLAIKSDGKFFIFDEDETAVINKTIALSDDTAGVLRIAIERDIDIEKSKSLNIHRTEDEIRTIWKEIVNNKCYTPTQQKYIDLALQMQFF